MLLPPLGEANDFEFVDFMKDAAYHVAKPHLSVSVIIPHYESYECLKKCIYSMSIQTFNPSKIEIVVADDGSKRLDLIAEILKEFKDKFQELMLISNQDKGFRLSRIRNRAISASSNRYIIILDCDMIAPSMFVENHLRVLCVSDHVVSVGFRKDGEVSQDLSLPIPLSELDWRYKTLLKKFPKWVKFGNTQHKLTSGGNLAASKSLFQEVTFSEEFTSWGGEDNEWGYRAIRRGKYIYPNIDASAYHTRPTTAHVLPKEAQQKVLEALKEKCPSVDVDNIYNQSREVPYVSIWITLKNKVKFLKHAIDSLQGFKFSHEILIVDNGSFDGSFELALDLASKNQKLRVVKEQQQGAFFAYERALQEARGEIFVQLDGDDVVDVDVLNRLVAEMYNGHKGLVYALTQPCDEALLPNASVWQPKGDIRENNLLRGMHVRNPRVFRARDLSRAPKRDFLQSAVDYNLYAHLLLVTSATQIDQVGYFYRKTDNALSAQREIQDQCALQVLERIRLKLCGGEALILKEIGARHVKYIETDQPLYYAKHLGLSEYAQPLLKEYVKMLITRSKL